MQGRLEEEFQNLFIQLKKGMWWREEVGTQIKKFKVCYFKLKINHGKKDFNLFSKVGTISSIWGECGRSKLSGQHQSFYPLIQAPKTKPEFILCFQNFTILNCGFQIIQIPLQQISEMRGRVQRKSSKIHPKNCAQELALKRTRQDGIFGTRGPTAYGPP